MNLSIKKLCLGLGLAGCAAFLGGCGGGYVGGGVDVVEPDYYGPAYGGAVFYGHPGYRQDSHIGGPPHREEQHRAPEQHSAPAPHPSGGGGGGGGGRTTPEPTNRRG